MTKFRSLTNAELVRIGFAGVQEVADFIPLLQELADRLHDGRALLVDPEDALDMSEDRYDEGYDAGKEAGYDEGYDAAIDHFHGSTD